MFGSKPDFESIKFMASLELRIEALEKENKMLHERVSMAYLRFQHIEYYLGILQHTFRDGERRFDFQQIKKDMVYDGRPIDRTVYSRRTASQRKDIPTHAEVL